MIEEYYFDDFYRVILVEEEEGYTLSVDVYLPYWPFGESEKSCVTADGREICLLFKELEINEFTDLVGKVVVTGSLIGGESETINVKYFLKRRPSTEEVRQLYEYASRLLSHKR